MSNDTLQTEFEFTLPQGYVDDSGTLHKEGRMRLATAADEIKPLKDPRVQSNSSYLTVVLLSRVVTELGDLPGVTPEVIESLFVSDLEYLQGLYERVNNRGENVVDTACPDCGADFGVAIESGTPVAASDDGVDAQPPGAGQTESSADVPEMETAPDMETAAMDPTEVGGTSMETADPDLGGHEPGDAEDVETGNPPE